MQKKQALLKLAHTFAKTEGTCLLYSGGTFDSAEKSFLALFPYQKVKGWESLKQSLGPLKDECPSLPLWLGHIEYEGRPFFQKYAAVIELDHKRDSWNMTLNEEFLEPSHISLLKNPGKWSFLPPLKTSEQIIHRTLQPLEKAEVYASKVRKALEHIYAGDIYQVNLSQQIVLEGSWDAFSLFLTLTNLNPAPFSAYLKLEDRALVSTSPERFLKKSGSLLETRPIKGTTPRGKTSEEESQRKRDLLQSPKELAELLMITDLMRNDLSTVSQAGSVSVSKLWHCETYTNVHHMLSIIHGNAKKELHPVEILKSCFPGGSITGCPKRRAMEIIQKLEGVPRGIYTGSIGYFTGKGDFDFNIAIRTAEIQGNRLSLRLGGGIVADSDPAKEYQETLHKGESFFQALGGKLG